VPTSVIPNGVEHWPWIDRIGIVLFDATLSAILFFSLVVLAMLACRQPARRILIARVALLASLAIIPMIGLESLPRLDVVDLLIDNAVVPRSLLITASPAESTLAAPGIPGIHGSARRVVDSLLPRNPTTLRWLERGLVLVYLSGLGTGLAWLLLGFGGVRWLIRKSREPSPATLLTFDQVVSDGPGTTRRPAVRVSSRVQHPVVVGLLRPTVLIPEPLDSPSADRGPLRLSFLHELAHIARSDHWFGTVASLAQSVWFLLPHTWWLRSQLLIDQEFLADCSAASRYGTSSEYASSLLSMASGTGPNLVKATGDSALPSGLPAKIGVPSALFQRMLMLLHCPFHIEARTPRLWSWTLRLSIIACSILAACLVIRWPHVGAVESVAKSALFPRPPRFRLANFEIAPLSFSPGGRSIAFTLPVLLPVTFDLEVELFSSPSDLPRIRIDGHPLKSPATLPEDPHEDSVSRSPDAKSWHRIHVHRDREHVTIQVDGETASFDSSSEPTTESITIEPGTNGIAEFRDLTVSW
jgi:beta-lactamase regulating signal transducer with metallopeptidase domain